MHLLGEIAPIVAEAGVGCVECGAVAGWHRVVSVLPDDHGEVSVTTHLLCGEHALAAAASEIKEEMTRQVFSSSSGLITSEEAQRRAADMVVSYLRNTPHHPMGNGKTCMRCTLPYSHVIHGLR